MTHHYWTYKRHRYWVCMQCGAACAEPNEGDAAKATCPGPPDKKKKGK